jgi:hypothetical protein
MTKESDEQAKRNQEISKEAREQAERNIGMKPCPFCGELPYPQKDITCYCMEVGQVWAGEKEWNSAWCWKEIARLEASRESDLKKSGELIINHWCKYVEERNKEIEKLKAVIARKDKALKVIQDKCQKDWCSCRCDLAKAALAEGQQGGKK